MCFPTQTAYHLHISLGFPKKVLVLTWHCQGIHLAAWKQPHQTPHFSSHHHQQTKFGSLQGSSITVCLLFSIIVIMPFLHSWVMPWWKSTSSRNVFRLPIHCFAQDQVSLTFWGDWDATSSLLGTLGWAGALEPGDFKEPHHRWPQQLCQLYIYSWAGLILDAGTKGAGPQSWRQDASLKGVLAPALLVYYWHASGSYWQTVH